MANRAAAGRDQEQNPFPGLQWPGRRGRGRLCQVGPQDLGECHTILTLRHFSQHSVELTQTQKEAVSNMDFNSGEAERGVTSHSHSQIMQGTPHLKWRTFHSPVGLLCPDRVVQWSHTEGAAETTR